MFGAAELLDLYRRAPLLELAALADAERRRRHPDGLVTYIVDRNINYTNVCVADCKFCAFYRRPKHAEGYVLSFEEIGRKIEEAKAIGAVQILMQGGHNPYIPFEWYLDLLLMFFFRMISQFPHICKHGDLLAGDLCRCESFQSRDHRVGVCVVGIVIHKDPAAIQDFHPFCRRPE